MVLIFRYESNPTATARLPKIHVFKKVSVEKLQRHQQIFAETSLKQSLLIDSSDVEQYHNTPSVSRRTNTKCICISFLQFTDIIMNLSSGLFFIQVLFDELSQFTNSRGTEGEGISLTPLSHFHPLHRQLDIKQVITTGSSHTYQPDSTQEPLVLASR